MLRLAMHTSSIFNSQHAAARCNRVAKRVQNVALNNIAIFWPELANAGPTMLGYVALRCCLRSVYDPEMRLSTLAVILNSRLCESVLFGENTQ